MQFIKYEAQGIYPVTNPQSDVKCIKNSENIATINVSTNAVMQAKPMRIHFSLRSACPKKME